MTDGGPAFPQPYDSVIETERGRELASAWSGHPESGMSLRDYFIVHAPAEEIGEIAPDTVGGCARLLGMESSDYQGEIHYVLVLAKVRAMWADAMLAERDKAEAPGSE